MKILHYAEYISIDKDKEFSKNMTGYGYMVSDIATSLANQDIDIDLLTFGGITNGKKYRNILILKKTWSDIFLNINYKYLFTNSINMIKNVPKSDRKRIFLSYIMFGFFQKTIKNNNYNLIHFHGISPASDILIRYCLKNNIKFIVTLHGLNSFSKSIKINSYYTEVEKNFLKIASSQKIPVTLISQGIKKDIKSFLQVKNMENFDVVTNGCDIKIKQTEYIFNISEKYNIKPNRKIALCIGNFTKNKNQIQVVKAYSKLEQKDKDRFVILFLGNPNGDKEVKEFIDTMQLSDDLIICSTIPKNKIYNYYAQADFTILASIQEGFGLSIIEGFVYGLPSLTFNDLNAITDIYNKRVMITLKNRDDMTLSHGMRDMLNKTWDKNIIKEYSSKFSLEKMANKYINLYKGLL